MGLPRAVWLSLALAFVLQCTLRSVARSALLPPTTLPLHPLLDDPTAHPPAAWQRRSAFLFPFPDPPEPTSPPVAPWILLPCLLLYTLLLLGSLGIVSGDYLVPNLSSLAAMLGLSDNTAGVTLLAFGNGSPDVFSTYASFQGNSGSLAVGELLGAALFIVTVVVGSMSFIQPFQVHRGPFLRDVGFALAAVALLLLVMRDGELQTWEAGAMVGLYGVYVAGVVGGGYVLRWKERREGRIRLEGDEEEGMLFDQERDFEEESYSDGHSSGLASPPHRPISLAPVQSSDLLHPSTTSTSPTSPDHSPAPRPHLRLSISSNSVRTRSSSKSGTVTPVRPSPHPHVRRTRSRSSSNSSFDVRRSTFSLLGAVEFRDIVNSLKKDEDELGVEALRTGLIGGSPFGGGHYHSHHLPHSHSHGHVRGKSTSGLPIHHTPRAGPATAAPVASSSFSPIPSSSKVRRPKSIPFVQSAIVPSSSAPMENRTEREQEVNPWEEGLSTSTGSSETVRPGHYSPSSALAGGRVRQSSSPSSVGQEEGENEGQFDDEEGSERTGRTPAPKIILSTASRSQTLLAAPSSSDPTLPRTKPSKRRWMMHILRLTTHTLFPSLQQFTRKSLVGQVLSVVATPAILALTVTVSVVDERSCEWDEDGSVSISEAEIKVGGGKRSSREEGREGAGRTAEVLHARLLDLGENPTRPTSPARLHEVDCGHHSHVHGEEEGEEVVAEEEETEEEMCCEEDDVTVALDFNKWLLAAQCILGPLLALFVLVPPEDEGFHWLPFTVVLSLGSAAALATVWLVNDGRHRMIRLARCLFGFAVSIVWIMALADEVVNVLTVMAELLGLSDAIVGLTVFAIGNSTADLVADLSIATFSPIMAFSACFGGPMLNILLGIGLSGAYVTLSSGAAYPIEISATLVTSVVSLLLVLSITFVFVPYNGYTITKKWGVFLIGFYLVAMTINVLAEIFWT